MHLLIVGATGRTGRLLTQLALEHEHTVTALVRDTSVELPAHERLSVVRGDVLEPESLPAAVAGQDAIVSLLAPRPRRNGRVYVEGTRNLADSAATADVRRLVVVSAGGATADPQLLPLAYRLVMRIPVVARLYPDIGEMERELSARRDLEWTIVAPPILTNGPGSGHYRVSTDSALPHGLRLSRSDLAHFCLETIEDGTFVRERVAHRSLGSLGLVARDAAQLVGVVHDLDAALPPGALEEDLRATSAH